MAIIFTKISEICFYCSMIALSNGTIPHFHPGCLRIFVSINIKIYTLKYKVFSALSIFFVYCQVFVSIHCSCSENFSKELYRIYNTRQLAFKVLYVYVQFCFFGKPTYLAVCLWQCVEQKYHSGVTLLLCYFALLNGAGFSQWYPC